MTFEDVELGDVDGDGDVDALVAGSGGALLLINDGFGSFSFNDQLIHEFPVSDAALGDLLEDVVIDRVEEFAVLHGVTSERKPGAIALHYRKAPDQEDACRGFVDTLIGEDSSLRGLHGKMVSEVALKGVDKGGAVARFMASPAFAERLPVMVGDDVTDEDGFRAAQAMGGFGIKIGQGPTEAQHRIEDVAGFADWLEEILR